VLTSAWLRCSARSAPFTPLFPVAEMLLLRDLTSDKVRSSELFRAIVCRSSELFRATVGRSSDIFRATVGTSSRSLMAADTSPSLFSLADPRAFTLIDVAARCSAATVTSGSGPVSSVRCRPSACTGITGCRMRGASTELCLSAGSGGCVRMLSWECSGVRCPIATGLVDRSDKDGRAQSSLNGSGLVREPASQSAARPRSPFGFCIVSSTKVDEYSKSWSLGKFSYLLLQYLNLIQSCYISPSKRRMKGVQFRTVSAA